MLLFYVWKILLVVPFLCNETFSHKLKQKNVVLNSTCKFYQKLKIYRSKDNCVCIIHLKNYLKKSKYLLGNLIWYGGQIYQILFYINLLQQNYEIKTVRL